jgi:hypothetical protein
MGVVNILKTLSQSGGPWVTGLLAGHGHFWVAFVAAGSLKATYDVLLLVFFAGRVGRQDKVGASGQDANGGFQRERGDGLEVETDRHGGEGEESEAREDSVSKSSPRP